MYNKLFTKILDSSIWLEDDATRLIWLTFLAAMDEDGFAQFASIPNLAHRARVSLDACTAAVALLEGPDAHSADPDNEGRRIERVPGGWMILNANKYRAMVTRLVIQEQTRARVARHRETKRGVTLGNGDVTASNDPVTPSHTDSDSPSNTDSKPKKKRKGSGRASADEMEDFCESLDLERSDGEYMFSKFEADGWPKNWQMKIRQWKIGGWLPSQKPGAQKKEPERVFWTSPMPQPNLSDQFAAKLAELEAEEKSNGLPDL